MWKRISYCLILSIILQSCATEEKESTELNQNIYQAHHTDSPMTIDGQATEADWAKADWYPLNQKWLGEDYSKEDFQGQYKILWDEQHVYYLVEVTDDVLMDIHEDDFKFYWDDDCVEIFIDEDQSKGIHQYNHNAFAHHIGLKGQAVDIGPDSIAHYYPDHIVAKYQQTSEHQYLWEVQMSVFDDTYQDFLTDSENKPVELHQGKKMGFAMAYCDNDTSETRENFIGSIFVEGEDKNRGWIDAGIFGTLELIE